MVNVVCIFSLLEMCYIVKTCKEFVCQDLGHNYIVFVSTYCPLNLL